jgi:anti-anti-sigma factor
MVMSFEKPRAKVLQFKQVNFLKNGNYTYSSSRDVIRLKGVVSHKTGCIIEEKILGGIAHKKINLIIDFTNVTSIDSDGVRVLNTASRMSRAFGRMLTLFGLCAEVREALVAAGIDAKFTICESEAEAIQEVA